MGRLAAILALLVALDAATTMHALGTGRFAEAGLIAARLIPILGPLYFAVIEFPALLLLTRLGELAPLGGRVLRYVPHAVVSAAVANNLAWLLRGGLLVSGSP